jgi:hypothetical protein
VVVVEVDLAWEEAEGAVVAQVREVPNLEELASQLLRSECSAERGS